MNSWFHKKKKLDGSLGADIDTYSKGKFLKFSEKRGWMYYTHCETEPFPSNRLLNLMLICCSRLALNSKATSNKHPNYFIAQFIFNIYVVVHI